MTTIREAHIARVVDNDDPEKRGRLRVASASLLGVDGSGEPVEYPDWVEPVFPVLTTDKDGATNGGIFFVPGRGSTVEIEVTAGGTFDQIGGQSTSTNPDPRWRAQLLQAGDTLPDDFKTNYPNRGGWLSSSGHLLMFDDSPADDNRVLLKHSSGSFIAIDGDGSIQLHTNKDGGAKHLFYLNSKDGEISIVDSNKNMFVLSDAGVEITAGNGTTMITVGIDGKITIGTGGEVALQGGLVSITAPAINLAAPAVAIGAAAALPALRGGTLATELLAEFALVVAELVKIQTSLASVPAPTPYVPGYTPNPALGASALSPATKVL